MSKVAAVRHIKKASEYVSVMITLINNNAHYLDILRKSRQAQSEIKAARTVLVNSHLAKCSTDLLQYKRQEKITEVIKMFKYR